jgi:Ca2+-binding EF-hand superfamily protein
MKKYNYLVLLIAIIVATATSCSSTSNSRPNGQGQMQGEDPSDMDTNGDQLISRDEATGMLLESFDEIDSNGDGNLSMEELKSYRDSSMGQQQGGQSQGQGRPQTNQSQNNTSDATSIINTLDIDGDKQISKAEAKGPILEMFDEIDADGNAKLSVDEINNSMTTLKNSNQVRSGATPAIASSKEVSNKSKVVILNKDEIDDGYSLIAPIGGTEVTLVDMDANKVFGFDTGDKISLDIQILDDGSILGSFENEYDSWTDNGNAGIIKLFNSEGDLSWTYNYSSDLYCSHHDVMMMENGNIAFIAWNKVSNKEAIENGVDLISLNGDDLWPDSIVEVNPLTNEIVWTWNSWDHIVQDVNPEANNYGNVNGNPNLIDINYAGKIEDVMHCNGIDYDADKDVFYLSSLGYGEIWVIDHSTTTEQAASHEGGNYGVGGDLVYRFGNPRAYDNNEGDVISLAQHAPTLTDDETLLAFINRIPGKKGQSEVVEFDLSQPFELLSNNNNEPSIVWSFTNKNLYSQNTSNATRLRNGNTLICEGDYGLWEVTSSGKVVWKMQYIDSSKKNVALFQSKRYYFDSLAVSNLGIDGSIVK